MKRTDGYAPIRDYAIIGDGRTSALVAADGSIDWLCLPDVDSPAVFARLLDAERGGSFRLEPEEPFESEQQYEPHGNVLQTTFRTASGTVRLTDAMSLTGDGLAPLREIVRRVEGLAGSVPMRWTFEPRCEYGTRSPRLEARHGCFVATHGRDAFALTTWDAGEASVADGRVAASFTALEGKTALLALASAHEEPLVLDTRATVDARLERVREFWPSWIGRATYEGPWAEAVRRSALVLKLLAFSPSGAIVAAPTTSLPEQIGGGRNWDYRFAWLRDAAWTLDALGRLGYRDEGHAFFWWIMHASRITLPRLKVLYRVDGGVDRGEVELDLAGYLGSRPVRIGNKASEQLQLDVYGAVLDAVWRFAEQGGALDGTTGKEIAEIADYVMEIWRKPDSGIWEVRSEPTHFTQSKAMCWVALDRACRLAAESLCPDREEQWRTEADAVRAFIDEHCFDAERGAYVRAPNMRKMDASLLTLALMRYAEPDDPRLVATVEAVRRELAEGPFVDRYRGEDGVAGDEGAFLTCSFWLAEALARIGRVDEGAELFEDLLGLANDVGLYAEEIDRETRAFLGNFPQGLTHLALVSAACTIAEASQ